MQGTYKLIIMDYLKEMERCLDIINEYQDMNIVTESFNTFIDLFVLLNNTMGLYEDIDVENIISESNTGLSNVLVNCIEAFHTNNQSIFSSIKLIETKFIKLSKLLVKHLKYKIILFGISELTLIIDKILDTEKVDIICYIDDTGKNTGKFINNIEISGLNKITERVFDYVFSVSTQTEIVNMLSESNIIGKERLINYQTFKSLIVSSPEFYIKHNKFLSNQKNYSGILTGLSYVQKGVDEGHLRGKFLNLANPGQDLFYDFEMFKYAFGFQEIREELKYAVIGLSYFSFHYDLSKSVNENRVNYYYPIVKTMHNNELSNHYLEYHNQLTGFEEKLLCETHFIEAFEINKSYFEKKINDGHVVRYDCQTRTDENLLADIWAVKRDYNKNYPHTVSENKQILRDYIDYLEMNSIKPIIIVCPVTKLYQAFTPPHFKNELYNVLKELKSEKVFQFLDYYSADEFDDSDFYDPSHMNDKGARKLARILNRDINW